MQAVATLAQRYASALASKNADTVKQLNPAHSGDLSGYKYLDASTVLPVSVALVQGDSYRLKHGLIANESRPEGTRTVLYCASWTVNLAAGTVSPGTGRTIRTVVGYVGVGAVSAELQRECA